MSEFDTRGQVEMFKTLSVKVPTEINKWLLAVATTHRLAGPAEAMAFVINKAWSKETKHVSLRGESVCVRSVREHLSSSDPLTITEIAHATGFSSQSVRLALHALGRGEEVTVAQRSYDKPTSLTGPRPTVYTLNDTGREKIALIAEAVAAEAEGRRIAAIPFDLKPGKLEAFRLATLAYVVKEKEQEEFPSEEGAAELMTLGVTFKAALDACAEWPAERKKVIDDLKKAQALADALKVTP